VKFGCHPERSEDRDRPDRELFREDLSRDFGIQNGGVDRMSEMSSMLCIPLYRDVPSHHEPN